MKLLESDVISLKEPGKEFFEGFPIGNGRHGAMLFGGIDKESIIINDDTVWSGYNKDRINPDSAYSYNKTMHLLANGEAKTARNLFLAGMGSSPSEPQLYQKTAELNIVNGRITSLRKESDYYDKKYASLASYERSLDMTNGVVKCHYNYDNCRFNVEAFASREFQALVFFYDSNKEAQIYQNISLTRSGLDYVSKKVGESRIELVGALPTGKSMGPYFTVLLEVRVVGKSAKQKILGSTMCIESADEVMIILTSCSKYRSPNHQNRCVEIINSMEGINYNQLKANHIKGHRSIYNAMKFSLPRSNTVSKQNDNNLELAKNNFDFGRYLLLASSAPNSLPANSQGIWTHNTDANSKSAGVFELGLPIHMNYWSANACGLDSCNEALFDFLLLLNNKGKEAARRIYGKAGSVFPSLTDCWGDCAPSGKIPKIHPTSTAWLALHLWQNFLFKQDTSWLRISALPIFKEVAQFFASFFKKNEQWQISYNFNNFTKKQAKEILNDKLNACEALKVCDGIILAEFFQAVISANKILEYDEELQEVWEESYAKITNENAHLKNLSNFLKTDFDYENRKFLKEISLMPLFGIFPGTTITRHKTPKIFQQAQNTIKKISQFTPELSPAECTWLAAILTRLGLGDSALEVLEKQIWKKSSSSYLNVQTLKSKEIFQISPNLGSPAVIAEMLLQSHDDRIHILPALPKSWHEGEISGLSARGKVDVDIFWENGELIYCQLKPKKDLKTKLQYRKSCLEIKLEANKEISFDKNLNQVELV